MEKSEIRVKPSYTNVRTYDEETARLERHGRRMLRALVILRLIIRIFDFLSGYVPLF
jgi:hypothetical protein